VEGNVLDTPAEPADSHFKDKLHHTAYPAHEASGIVFAYLGPRDQMPLFPNYAWASVPADRVSVTKTLQDCNYLQGLEGECDSSHLRFLHSSFDEAGQARLQSLAIHEYLTEETDFGVRLIAMRNRKGRDRTCASRVLCCLWTAGSRAEEASTSTFRPATTSTRGGST